MALGHLFGLIGPAIVIAWPGGENPEIKADTRSERNDCRAETELSMSQEPPVTDSRVSPRSHMSTQERKCLQGQMTLTSRGLPETLLCPPTQQTTQISSRAFHSLEFRNPVVTWNCFLNFLISQSFSKGKYKTTLPKSQFAQRQFLIQCIDPAKPPVPTLSQSLLRVSAYGLLCGSQKKAEGSGPVPGAHGLWSGSKILHRRQDNMTESSQEPGGCAEHI